MTTSMFKYTYRSESQGIPSKLECHAILNPDRKIVVLHNRSRTDDHNKPSWNQTDFVGGHSLCRTTANNFLSTIPASWSFRLQERNKKWCSPNTNDHHPSFFTVRRYKIQKLCKPRMGGTRSKLYFITGYKLDIFYHYKILNINQSWSI